MAYLLYSFVYLCYLIYLWVTKVSLIMCWIVISQTLLAFFLLWPLTGSMGSSTLSHWAATQNLHVISVCKIKRCEKTAQSSFHCAFGYLSDLRKRDKAPPNIHCVHIATGGLSVHSSIMFKNNLLLQKLSLFHHLKCIQWKEQSSRSLLKHLENWGKEMSNSKMTLKSCIITYPKSRNCIWIAFFFTTIIWSICTCYSVKIKHFVKLMVKHCNFTSKKSPVLVCL